MMMGPSESLVSHRSVLWGLRGYKYSEVSKSKASQMANESVISLREIEIEMEFFTFTFTNVPQLMLAQLVWAPPPRQRKS